MLPDEAEQATHHGREEGSVGAWLSRRRNPRGGGGWRRILQGRPTACGAEGPRICGRWRSCLFQRREVGSWRSLGAVGRVSVVANPASLDPVDG